MSRGTSTSSPGDGGQLGLLDHILDDLLLDFRGGLVRDFNNLGGLCGNFSRLFRLWLLDLHEDLGGNGLKQLAGGEFEDFVAYVDVITVNAESLAGACTAASTVLALISILRIGGTSFLFLIVTFITTGSGAGAYRMRPYGGRGYTPSQPPTARASNARPYSLCNGSAPLLLCNQSLFSGVVRSSL